MCISCHVLKCGKLIGGGGWDIGDYGSVGSVHIVLQSMGTYLQQHAWCNMTRNKEKKKKAFYQNGATSSFSLCRCFAVLLCVWTDCITLRHLNGEVKILLVNKKLWVFLACRKTPNIRKKEWDRTAHTNKTPCTGEPEGWRLHSLK